MPRYTRHIIAFTLLLLAILDRTSGQSGFYVPQKGKVFFSGDSATIFSNVINQGQLGIGKNAVLNFKARQWENDPLSLITDESNNGNGTTGTGGVLRFLLPDTSWPNRQQLLSGGYNAATHSGASFPNITVANGYGLSLFFGSTKIRRQLHFEDGHVYAQENILVVGDGTPGIITGYDENHFVITGTSVTGGFLLREKISLSDGWVSFPVGTAAGRYTPAALRTNNSVPDDFYTRVSDSVKSNAIGGQDMAAASVNKTWQIGQLLHPGQGEVDITLQHQLPDEGSLFQSKRQNAYVSQYINGAWDTGYPQLTPQAGNLTSGNPISNSGTNTRYFANTLAANSYFTKLTGLGDTSLYKTNLWFSAYRTDYRHVWVYWKTNPEIGQKYFIVQRRLSNEAVFSNRDSVPSQAINGSSFRYLNYGITDFNNYGGVSFYRLLMISYKGDTTYSNIVAVGGHPGGYGLVLWPNPSDGRFYIGISASGVVKTIVIYNAIGQLMRVEEVNNRGFIEMFLRTPGAYMVSFISYDGTVLDTRKLIIGGH
ncbi:MAG TPA: T9SS type A sorting domain-containing protein [Chitinophagaceae bacterium]|nr:T9SS type A sorting domain-containing protein [Chitinophagaceae bacterium]